MTANPPPSRADVVVAGGGIAALEFVLALRELAGDRVRMTLIAPGPDFVLRPMLVAEPLGLGAALRHPLSRIASDLDLRHMPASVASVDPAERRVALRSGATLRYDTLVLTPGARTLPAFDGVISLGDAEGTAQLQTMRDEIAQGLVRSVAFVAPTLTGWLLPLYEAALITAHAGPATVSVITPEQRPLELFGADASATVARMLDDAGIEFVGGQQADVSAGAVLLSGRPGRSLAADRIVSLPLVRGPKIPGIPEAGMFGLIPVDPHGRVAGLSHVYAAGDATDFSVKQGAIACQQADAVASHVAARHGAAVSAAPFQPILGAMLLAGDGTPVALGVAEGTAPSKLPGQYLAPYMRSRVDAARRTAV